MTDILKFKITSKLLIIIAVIIPGCTSAVKIQQGVKPRVYVAGPVSSPFELKALKEISEELESSGYLPYIIFSSGPAAFLNKMEKDKNVSHNILDLRRRFLKPVFCYELFKLLEESDSLVMNMNGRTPDLNGIFLTAAAFSAGIPLAIYKNDHRSVFHGNNNSMIDGCSYDFSTVSSLRDLPEALEDAISDSNKSGAKKMEFQSYVKKSVEAGREISLYMNSLKVNSKLEDPVKVLQMIEGITNKISADESRAGKSSTTSMVKAKVYCSGGLFSPGEIGEMKAISDNLEASGFATFLPQRDGVEAFVMNNTDSCVANSILTRPFLLSVNKMVFELDVYEIIDQCDYFVFNMNGAAPDEGGVVETAIAMMHGKPVFIYKSSSFDSWYPFILGSGENSAIIVSIGDIPAEIKKFSHLKLNDKTPVQPNVLEVINRGRGAKLWTERLKWAKPANKMDTGFSR